MMSNKKQLSIRIATFLLTIALMFPMTIQLFHITEHHHEDKTNIVNKKETTQFQKSDIECDVCQYNLTSFHYNIKEYHEAILLKIPLTVENNFSSPYFSVYKNNTQLRAPPSLLIA